MQIKILMLIITLLITMPTFSSDHLKKGSLTIIFGGYHDSFGADRSKKTNINLGAEYFITDRISLNLDAYRIKTEGFLRSELIVSDLSDRGYTSTFDSVRLDLKWYYLDLNNTFFPYVGGGIGNGIKNWDRDKSFIFFGGNIGLRTFISNDIAIDSEINIYPTSYYRNLEEILQTSDWKFSVVKTF